MDQYLYPYYRRDVEPNQTLDREHAIEMPWLLVEIAEVNKIRPAHTQSLCGKSAVSERHHWRAKSVDGQPMDA